MEGGGEGDGRGMEGGWKGGWKGGGGRGSTFLLSTRDEKQIFVSDFFSFAFLRYFFTTVHLYDDTIVVPDLLNLVRNIFNSEGAVKSAHSQIFWRKGNHLPYHLYCTSLLLCPNL